MRKEISFTLLPLLLVLFGCGECPAPPPPPTVALAPGNFSAERAYDELVQLLDLGLRDSGTPGAKAAAEHIRQRLETQGVEAEIDAFEDRCPKGDIIFRNVIGRIPGRGEGIIVLGSHYDTKAGMGEGFEGANDSGSSTAVLIELGRLLAEGPRLGPDVILAFFDGEECMERYGPADGLHGSKRMVRQLQEEGKIEEVQAMILLDMIGDRDLTVTIPRNVDPELVRRAFKAATEEGVRTQFSLYSFSVGDDHEPFLEAGIPAINLIDFHFGSAPGRNDYWHTPEDTLDKISPESMGVVGRVTVRMINDLVSGSR